MRLHAFSPVLAAVALIAAPASAQEQPVDPIGALLDNIPPASPAAEPATPSAADPSLAPAIAPHELGPPPLEAQPSTPPTAPAYVPPASMRRARDGVPVQIDQVGRTPDNPPTASDRNYEARMRASFAASQGMQGPLDGRWVIRAGSNELYELQLVDKSSRSLEGAWRDPRRKGAADAAGFLEDIQRYGTQLTVRIQAKPGVDPVRIVLEAAGNGDWSGQLTEAGDRRAVTMKRD
jgi:hypothetical protein